MRGGKNPTAQPFFRYLPHWSRIHVVRRMAWLCMRGLTTVFSVRSDRIPSVLNYVWGADIRTLHSTAQCRSLWCERLTYSRKKKMSLPRCLFPVAHASGFLRTCPSARIEMDAYRLVQLSRCVAGEAQGRRRGLVRRDVLAVQRRTPTRAEPFCVLLMGKTRNLH